MKLDGTFIATGDNLTIVYKNKTYQFNTPSNLGVVIRLLRENKFQKAIDSINKKFLIQDITCGVVKETKSGKYKIGKEIIPESIRNIIDKVVSEKKPIDCVIALWNRINSVSDKVTENEKRIAKESIFDYLVNTCVKITEDGCFIAYKKVREDYKDCHSGTFDNTPGNIVSQDRKLCVVARNQACSSGLHVGAWEYVHRFGGSRILECLVDPVDVVSVPFDYKNMKMRVCRYKVIRDVTEFSDRKELLLGSPTLYEGYIESVDEKKVVKKVEVVKNVNKKKVKQTRFEVTRISEGRFSITKTINQMLGFEPGTKIGIRIEKKVLVVEKNNRLSEYEVSVGKDGSTRLSKMIVDRISKKDKLFIDVQKTGLTISEK